NTKPVGGDFLKTADTSLSRMGLKQEPKSLSTRTHVCTHCGHTQDRDWNAAQNILVEKGLSTAGHVGTNTVLL
ncbi:MAG: zinc ribbon domain-containing protein, partial [Nostoc sp.]